MRNSVCPREVLADGIRGVRLRFVRRRVSVGGAWGGAPSSAMIPVLALQQPWRGIALSQKEMTFTL